MIDDAYMVVTENDPDCPHDRVVVIYQASVFATVEDGEVTAVSVGDEDMGQPTEVACRDCSATWPLGHPIAAAAIAVAEGDGEWPSWEFG